MNSAHPFENATPLSNFLELLSILVISAALCYTFGAMVGDTRQGWAVLAAMTIVFVGLLAVCVVAEQRGATLGWLGVDHQASDLQSGGNMEGKEVRYGIANSALWATATTAASNGSVNSMHDSFTPIGGLVPMWLMQLGEVIYGGVGSGLYGMLVFAIIAVFVAGLMVGRTPEYLGKKIEAYEMKMASLVILIPPAVVLIGTAIAVVSPAGKATIYNPGPHGFSEVLYAFSSAGNNNGSAFAGLGANTPFYNTALGLAMLFARYWLAIPTLAIAGSLARKKAVPPGPGTLPTHTPLFVVLLIGVVLLVGALTFVPALALGPIVEHLIMMASEVAGGDESHGDSDEGAIALRRPHRAAGRRRRDQEARSPDPGPEPGHVRRARGERPHDRPLAPGAARPGRGARGLHLLDLRVALVHRALRELRRGDGGGARQGPGRGPPADAPGRPGQAPGEARAGRGRHAACRAARSGRATSSSSRPAT